MKCCNMLWAHTHTHTHTCTHTYTQTPNIADLDFITRLSNASVSTRRLIWCDNETQIRTNVCGVRAPPQRRLRRLPVTGGRMSNTEWLQIHHTQLSACQGESGLLRCVSLGVSHSFFYLPAVFPVTKINIWASAAPEGLIFPPSLTAAPCFTFRRLLTLRTWSSSEQPLEHLRLCSCHSETAVSCVQSFTMLLKLTLTELNDTQWLILFHWIILHNQFKLLQNMFLSSIENYLNYQSYHCYATLKLTACI